MINPKENLVTLTSELSLAELQTAIAIAAIIYQQRMTDSNNELAYMYLSNIVIEICEFGLTENLNLHILQNMEEVPLDEFPEIIHALATALLCNARS